MMFRSRAAQTMILAASFALIMATAGDRAYGEGNLDASYTISFARIPVGEIIATAVFGESEYMISARARAGGVMKVLAVDGEASFTTRGTIKDGHLEPTNFISKVVSHAENADVTMILDEGGVRELVGAPAGLDRVPVTAANRRGIVDPLTAVLVSAGVAGETLSQEACRRTLPIFDGQQRYDLKLAFKRMDKMTAEKGYAGPVVVCSVNYEPIAGHRPDIPLVKYLSEGREIEIALAPIAGTRLMAPFRLSVVSTLANFMIEANRFETIMAPAPEGMLPNISPTHSGVVERSEGAGAEQDQRQSRSNGVVERCVRVGPDLVRCQEVRESAPGSNKPAPRSGANAPSPR
jgi:hypothetical protein